MKKELSGIAAHETWEPAPHWTGRTVKSKWAFRVTREDDGSIKYRARIVAKGFSEIRGVDYWETYAPTVASKAVQALLHIAASEDWEIRSLDIGNAYLEAELDTVIYMKVPTATAGGEDTIVKLKKSLYGLKQSGDLWNKRIHSILEQLGFSRTYSDPCIYVRTTGKNRTYMALYVDDLLITGSSNELILQLENDIESHVTKLTRKGDIQKFLGVEVSRDRTARTITLRQSQFIRDIIISEGLNDAKTKSTPGSSSVDLYTAQRGNRDPLRSIVGKIRYAVDHAHPEALFIASQLSAAAGDPGDLHWDAANHCLRYLHGAADIGITLGGHQSIKFECWVDASYIESGEAKSQLGYCLRLNSTSGMFYSKSKRDSSVSLSSAEAELRALKEAIQEILWARFYLEELGYPQSNATTVFEDNQAVIDLMKTLQSKSRTRHLNKIRKFVQQHIDNADIIIEKVAGEVNIADILTKALEKDRFQQLRKGMLGI